MTRPGVLTFCGPASAQEPTECRLGTYEYVRHTGSVQFALIVLAALPLFAQKPALPVMVSFDGLGGGRNPSDNSLAVGREHVVQTVNSRFAVYDKIGKTLYGPVPTNTIFKGLGGPCEARPNGDAVIRYDQLANRWLLVMPIFRKIEGRPDEPYSMCYAVSKTEDPTGDWNRYEFRRRLFPDYPRPAIWPDGYYTPTSTGDEVIQKHVCIADRARMLKGEPATEQCIVIDGVNFLNNADIEGYGLPPAGAPNIMMAAGGTQLKGVFEDEYIYFWKVRVDWADPSKTALAQSGKVKVAPYHYLCNGQLTNCVPQPGTDRRLDAQGDKLMQRLIYRKIGGHESILAQHSVDAPGGGGGVRWYEFRLDRKGDPTLYQQGTYAPDAHYRWMASLTMDANGNIGAGYSYGGADVFPGQRFSGRMAADPPGQFTFAESVLVEGEASQSNASRWQDYTTTALDPDDCTFWYVGDYIKKDATTYSTKIGAFRFPGCGFEVASVKTAARAVGPDYNNQLTIKATSISGKNVTLKRLIQEAYGIQPYQVSGPGWIGTNEYAIEAKAARPSDIAQMRGMLKALLAERFHLAVHTDSKEQRVYELTADAGGPKMKPAAAGRTMPEFANFLAVRLTIPTLDDPSRPGMATGTPTPVIDRTGLTGKYDLRADVRPEPEADMFTLWQRLLHEQYGLKLESRRAKVDLIVVDKADRTPSAN